MKSKRLEEMIDALKGLVFYSSKYGEFFKLEGVLKRESPYHFTISSEGSNIKFIKYNIVSSKRDEEAAIYILRRFLDGRYYINQSLSNFSYYYETRSNSYYYLRKINMRIKVKETNGNISIKKPQGLKLVLPTTTIAEILRKKEKTYIKIGNLIGEIIRLKDINFFRVISPQLFLNVYISLGEATGEEGVHNNNYEIIYPKEKEGLFYACASCGNYYVKRKGDLCSSCKENFDRCELCKELRDKNYSHYLIPLMPISYLDRKNVNKTYTNPIKVCRVCDRTLIFKCEHCNNSFLKTDKWSFGGTYTHPNGRTIWLCKKCQKEAQFFTCEICHGKYLIDYSRIYGEQTICIGCYDRIMREAQNSLHSYNFVPLFTKKKKKWDNKLLMGFELEVMTRIPNNRREIDFLREKAMEITYWLKENKLDKYFFIKNDGSLREEGRRSGFEVNSHPFSLNAKKFLKIKNMLSFLKSKGFVSYEAKPCGFHVHLSANFFSSNPNKDMSIPGLIKDQTFRDNVCKLLSFFSVNASKIYSFSKREERHYCKPISFDEWAFYTTSDSAESFNAFVKGFDRYSIINITNLFERSKKKTIEIRSFKGTLDHNRFIATLQFCDAIAHFIKQISVVSMIKNNKKSWQEFTQWIKDTNSYGHLYNYLMREDLI